ncbi:glutathione S-transferase family protein [Sphingobium sp. MK2]|uniref:glutathione S-transferase family protein n=1 Tax=Sphingobium sp. MK2 TaxID=3116540 RepID=UPI0032E3688A
MKLHWSPRSPFVRIVMIAAHELGIADRLTLVRTVAAMSEVNPQLSADNPLNKLPTLVLDDGKAVFDSRVILRLLDSADRLHPVNREAGLETARWQAMGMGLLDILVLLRNERDRPENLRSHAHMTAWKQKVANSLDWLEQHVGELAARQFDVGHVAVGCALGYLDLRFAELDWRYRRPNLVEWGAAFEARSSAMACRGEID